MKIVISDLDHVDHEIETQTLHAAGFQFEKLDCKTEDDLIQQLKGVSVVINQYAPFTRRVFEALPDLRAVVRYGVGVNHIDLQAAADAGVHVSNVPDYGMNEVSDHAVALALALVRKLVPMNNDTHAGGWDYQHAIPIRRTSCMVAGVIGLGRIGRLYAQKMHAMGYRVIGADPAMRETGGLEFVEMVTLDDVVTQSDIIALFCPLNDETRHIIDAAAIARMKSGACVVNTARGGLIDETALAAALNSGALGGAGIDVCATEPLQQASPLRGIANCILTPHMAWYSEEAGDELKRKVAEEAIRFMRGEALHWDLSAALRRCLA
ncbi:C-terminal binding protein [Paracoccus sp. Z330]|uniref:C-terminal binding protein n=1 Tax=Paracoccus onchidii TaxID=3017813 RepID=A0ABT4ZG89_9RHOB|nr:C-terminal binding protein [Paracoccus onchidii]MDB6178379.1 C-terminal binding protein [Paracoccus onchidii]